MVGTARIGSDDVSAIALPRPVVDPPPIATAQSAPTYAAYSRASRAVSTGTCITAFANTPAAREPNRSASASACSRCCGVDEHDSAPGPQQIDLALEMVDAARTEHHARGHALIDERFHGLSAGSKAGCWRRRSPRPTSAACIRASLQSPSRGHSRSPRHRRTVTPGLTRL